MNLLASLRYLAALDEHKHFGRAAQACHITQPALSNALRALEAEFDTVIVKRGRNFEGFTEEGARVLASSCCSNTCSCSMRWAVASSRSPSGVRPA